MEPIKRKLTSITDKEYIKLTDFNQKLLKIRNGLIRLEKAINDQLEKITIIYKDTKTLNSGI